MSAPRYAAIVAKLIGREAPRSPVPSSDGRTRAIALIELELAKKAKRRRVRTASVAALGLTAAVAAAWLVRAHRAVERSNQRSIPAITATLQPSGSGARVLTASGSEALTAGSSLPVGGQLVADAEGGASLRLSTGTEISVEHGASLTFSGAGATERFELTSGEMHAHVAKLTQGQRFIVKTPDAEVEVRGTVFQVSVVEPDAGCGSGTRTRVSVSEGLVEVRASTGTFWVRPGEAWPNGCAVSTLQSTQVDRAEGPPSKHPSAAAAQRSGQKPAAEAPAASSSSQPSSSLAEQNDLFTAAVAARRSGDPQLALSKLNELNSRFPTSALSEAVAAERFRASAGQSHPAAVNAAREYLAKYPQGFARSEAESILGAP